jgi:hypothetical protein
MRVYVHAMCTVQYSTVQYSTWILDRWVGVCAEDIQQVKVLGMNRSLTGRRSLVGRRGRAPENGN